MYNVPLMEVISFPKSWLNVPVSARHPATAVSQSRMHGYARQPDASATLDARGARSYLKLQLKTGSRKARSARNQSWPKNKRSWGGKNTPNTWKLGYRQKDVSGDKAQKTRGKCVDNPSITGDRYVGLVWGHGVVEVRVDHKVWA